MYNKSESQCFPLWYIINDSLIIVFNLITIFIGLTFVFLILREKKLRTIINTLSSNSCLCGLLVAITIIWDAFHMLKTDITGIVQQDQACIVRNICMLITMIALNYSLCIQTYHRFITIVHSLQTSLHSMKFYLKIIVIQWLISPCLMLPIILSGKIIYQTGSFICQISFSNTTLFSYLFIISYGIPVLFIVTLHLSIAYHIKVHWKTNRQRRLSSTHIICPMQRIILIILVLIISYFPCGIFFILEHLHVTVVPYAQKIILLFASLSFALTMLLTFKFNRSVRNSSLTLVHRKHRPIIIYKFIRKSRE
ncbi:hypothetical protein I4U23_017634 [Adineta vaga]|nr:hypothetical protein I4U23_017634 [Adineta vaga]